MFFWAHLVILLLLGIGCETQAPLGVSFSTLRLLARPLLSLSFLPSKEPLNKATTMPYQHSVGTSDCGSRLGDFTSDLLVWWRARGPYYSLDGFRGSCSKSLFHSRIRRRALTLPLLRPLQRYLPEYGPAHFSTAFHTVLL